MNRTIPIENVEGFRKDLTALINKYGLENACDTPDYILADFLINVYDTYCLHITRRDEWFGFDPFGDNVVEKAEETPEAEQAEPAIDAKAEPEIEEAEDQKSELGFVVYKRVSHNVYTFFVEWRNKKPVFAENLDLAMRFDYKSMAENIASNLGEGWRVVDLDEINDEEECRKCENLLKAIFGEERDLNNKFVSENKYSSKSHYHIIVPKGTRLKIVRVDQKPKEG